MADFLWLAKAAIVNLIPCGDKRAITDLTDGISACSVRSR